MNTSMINKFLMNLNLNKIYNVKITIFKNIRLKNRPIFVHY